MRIIIVTLLVVGLLLSAGAAWSAAYDDFQNANTGVVNGQNSGSGWAEAWIAPVHGGDQYNRAEVIDTSGNKWLRLRFYEVTTNRTVSRKWDTAPFVGAPQIHAGLDLIITKTTAQMYRAFQIQFMQGANPITRLEFNWEGNIIVNLPSGNVTVGKWDVLRNVWRTFQFDIDVANQTWGFTIDGNSYGSGYAFRTPYDPSLPLDGIRFLNGSTNSLDAIPEYIGLDNIWISTESGGPPEPPDSCSIRESKRLADDQPVLLLEKTATAVFADHFYVEEADRSSGIRVFCAEMPAGLAIGHTVDVEGTMQTNADNERYIDAVSVTSKMPAFPEAEGFGAYSRGGRGGNILFVTNLQDYDPATESPIPGSFRAAVAAAGPRIIVFRVSGTIPLKAKVFITQPYLTIAGQTAPGGGICLKNFDVSVRTHDVIIRHMRFRPGDEMGPIYQAQGLDFQVCGISMNAGASNVIIDHCSASWSTDEVLSVSGEGITDITVQWCVISESLNNSYRLKGEHGYGSNIRTNGNVTYHHNLYISHKSRTPRVGTYGSGSIILDFRNNVIYNSMWGGYSSTDPAQMNYVGNYIKPGPNCLWNCAFLIGGDTTRIYAEDNNRVGNPCSANCPCWQLLAGPYTGGTWGVFHNAKSIHKRTEPFPAAPVATDSVAAVYDRVLSEAGATLPARDAVDVRVINDVITGSGQIIDSQSQVGGWPQLQSTAPPVDTSGDGLPDWWKLAHGMSPTEFDAHKDPDGDGYTNIEEFLNGTNPNSSDGGIKPLGLSGRFLGGGDCLDPVSGIGQAGVCGGSGLNNIGLLVKTWGRVTHVGAGHIYIDDGSEIADGSGHLGVRVSCNPTGIQVSDFVTVAGISSCFKNGDVVARCVLTRTEEDVKKQQ